MSSQHMSLVLSEALYGGPSMSYTIPSPSLEKDDNTTLRSSNGKKLSILKKSKGGLPLAHAQTQSVQWSEPLSCTKIIPPRVIKGKKGAVLDPAVLSPAVADAKRTSSDTGHSSVPSHILQNSHFGHEGLIPAITANPSKSGPLQNTSGTSSFSMSDRSSHHSQRFYSRRLPANESISPEVARRRHEALQISLRHTISRFPAVASTYERQPEIVEVEGESFAKVDEDAPAPVSLANDATSAATGATPIIDDADAEEEEELELALPEIDTEDMAQDASDSVLVTGVQLGVSNTLCAATPEITEAVAPVENVDVVQRGVEPALPEMNTLPNHEKTAQDTLEPALVPEKAISEAPTFTNDEDPADEDLELAFPESEDAEEIIQEGSELANNAITEATETAAFVESIDASAQKGLEPALPEVKMGEIVQNVPEPDEPAENHIFTAPGSTSDLPNDSDTTAHGATEATVFVDDVDVEQQEPKGASQGRGTLSVHSPRSPTSANIVVGEIEESRDELEAGELRDEVETDEARYEMEAGELRNGAEASEPRDEMGVGESRGEAQDGEPLRESIVEQPGDATEALQDHAMDTPVEEDAFVVDDKTDHNDSFEPGEIIEISSDSDDDGLAELRARTYDDREHDQEYEHHDSEPQPLNAQRDIIDSGSDSDPDDIFGDRHGHFSEEEGVHSYSTEPEMSEHTTDVATASSPVSTGSSMPEEILSPAIHRQLEDSRSASEIARQWAESRKASGQRYARASGSKRNKRKAESLGSDSSEDEEETRKKRSSRLTKRAKAIVEYDTMVEWSGELARIYRKRKAASGILDQKELLNVLKEVDRQKWIINDSDSRSSRLAKHIKQVALTCDPVQEWEARKIGEGILDCLAQRFLNKRFHL